MTYEQWRELYEPLVDDNGEVIRYDTLEDAKQAVKMNLPGCLERLHIWTMHHDDEGPEDYYLCWTGVIAENEDEAKRKMIEMLQRDEVDFEVRPNPDAEFDLVAGPRIVNVAWYHVTIKAFGLEMVDKVVKY
jgi:hypothetical protein